MLTQAREAIRQCEEQLRTLMAEASADGKYDDVDTIMDWARKLRDLAGGSGTQTAPSASSSKRKSSVQARKSTRRAAGKARGYPQFLRSRDDLLKIGWSKKEKKEYQHRAPWSVVESLCRTIAAQKSEDFTSEDLLPLLADDGDEVPSYQSYLSIAWLRDTGLIAKDGRQGYHAVGKTDLLKKAKIAWENLPEKSS